MLLVLVLVPIVLFMLRLLLLQLRKALVVTVSIVHTIVVRCVHVRSVRMQAGTHAYRQLL